MSRDETDRCGIDRLTVTSNANRASGERNGPRDHLVFLPGVKLAEKKRELIKRYLLAGRAGFSFMTIAELTASGHSRRPSGRSPYSALFVAGSLEHRPFERVIICACIIASTSLPSPVNHIRTLRATPPLAALFERVSILRTHHATTLYVPKKREKKNDVSAFSSQYLNIKSTRRTDVNKCKGSSN